MKNFKIGLCILITLFIATGCTINKSQEENIPETNDVIETDSLNLSMEEKVEDFNQMIKIIEDGYPYLKVLERNYGYNWLERKDIYENQIKETENDTEFIITMNKILGELGDFHTGLILSKSDLELLKDDYDDQYFISIYKDNSKLRYDSLENSMEDMSLTSLLKEMDNGLILKDVVENEIGYMYVPTFGPGIGYSQSVEDSINANLELIQGYIKNLENHKALIIDIRGNFGGIDYYWQEIVSMLIHEEMEQKGYTVFKDSSVINEYVDVYGQDGALIEQLPEEIKNNCPPEVISDFQRIIPYENPIEAKPASNFKGNIYLLVDKYVYSAAENFAFFAKDTGFATVVGSKTNGGSAFDYGFALFSLKNSGLIGRMTSGMTLSTDGFCNEDLKTTPDYVIIFPERQEDILQDKCIQEVIKLENEVN